VTELGTTFEHLPTALPQGADEHELAVVALSGHAPAGLAFRRGGARSPGTGNIQEIEDLRQDRVLWNQPCLWAT
jgi:hypothetical protein